MKVSRLRYVSPLFVTVLVRSGYESIRTISNATSNKLHEEIIKTNKEQQMHKGNVGDRDARFIIEDVKMFMKYE